MDLVTRFLPIVFGARRPDFNSTGTQLVFPGFEDFPTVYIEFIGILMQKHREKSLRVVEEPVLNAIWALKVFKYNGWRVEIFSLGEEVNIIREWVSKYAPGLVHRIKKSCLEEIFEREKTGNHVLVDVLDDSLKDSGFGKEVDWVGIMTMLVRMGFLRVGLLPLKGERVNDMGVLLKEPVFQDLVLDLKEKRGEEGQTRGDIIKLIEYYAKHPEIVGVERDLLARARVEGSLLENVLKLLTRDRFDPVGCIILAQQEREIKVAKMSPMLEVDVE